MITQPRNIRIFNIKTEMRIHIRSDECITIITHFKYINITTGMGIQVGIAEAIIITKMAKYLVS